VLSLWSGLPVSLWLVSNPVIVYYSYDSIKERFLTGRYTWFRTRSTTHNYARTHASSVFLMTAVKRRSLSGFEAFVLGAVAKAVATVMGALTGRCNTDI
jgi:hypothetical protein